MLVLQLERTHLELGGDCEKKKVKWRKVHKETRLVVRLELNIT